MAPFLLAFAGSLALLSLYVYRKEGLLLLRFRDADARTPDGSIELEIFVRARWARALILACFLMIALSFYAIALSLMEFHGVFP